MPSWLAESPVCLDEPQLKAPVHFDEPQLEALAPDWSIDRAARKRAKKRVKNEFDAHYKTCLRGCETLQDIGRLPKMPDIDMERVLQYSKLAFEHLMLINSNQTTLIAFLEDPVLNTAAAINLLTYVTHLKQYHKRASGWAGLCQYVRKAVRLGLLSDRDIRRVIRTSRAQIKGGTGTRTSMSMDAVLIKSIWDGLRESSVFSVEAIHGTTLRLMVDKLGRETCREESCALVASIAAAATQAQLATMNRSVGSFLLAWVESWEFEGPDGKEPHQQYGVVPGLARFIDDLPQQLVCSSLTTATLSLLGLKKDREVEHASVISCFRLWMNSLCQSTHFKQSVLGSRAWDVIENWFITPKCSGYLSIYLQTLDDIDQCNFIIRHYAQHHLQVYKSLNLDDVHSAIVETFNERVAAQSSMQCYSNLIFALYIHRQRYNLALHLMFRILRETGRSDTVIQIIEHLTALQIPLPAGMLGEETRRYCLTSTRVALRIFELDWHLQLDVCLELALALINDPLSHPDTALRFLEHHRKAAQVRPERGHPYPVARTRLLHEMATAFAHASHLSPRQAFRKVYRCYVFLSRDGFLIQAQLIRAFVHAGIVRNLQAGEPASSAIIEWILRKVRQVEGEEAELSADRLIYRWRGTVQKDLRRRQRREAALKRQSELEAEVYAAAIRSSSITHLMGQRFVSNRMLTQG